MRYLTIGFACLAVLAATPVYGQPRVDVYNPFEVLTLCFEMNAEDWDTIRYDTTNDIEVPAMFWAEGGPEPPSCDRPEPRLLVSVRRKSSRALPSESNPIKVGLKVDINEFVRGQLWHGLAKLSLENGADTDPISEGLAWNLHELASVDGFYGAGYHAGLASWVRVVVNGTYIGVYISVEQRDTQFLRNRGLFFEDKTWLYEIDDLGAGSFELEVGDLPHIPTYQALCYSPFTVGNKKNPPCPTPSDAALETDLPRLIDMQVMLTQGAIDAFSSNNDALFTHGKNFRFADFDSSLGRRRLYYMWDLDGAITNVSANIYAQKNQKSFTQTPYQYWILNDPLFRLQYNAIMTGLLDPDTGPLSEAALHNFLSGVETAVMPALAGDPYAGFGSAGAVASLLNGLRNWVSERISIVLVQVEADEP